MIAGWTSPLVGFEPLVGFCAFCALPKLPPAGDFELEPPEPSNAEIKQFYSSALSLLKLTFADFDVLHAEDSERAVLVGGVRRNVVHAICSYEPKLALDYAICI